MQVSVRASLAAEPLGVMTFLNEVAARYPDAISLAPGRPPDHLLGVAEGMAGVQTWLAWRAAQGEPTELDQLGQYNRTSGIIHPLVCRWLERDEGIACTPEDLIVTNGCQEAMALLLLGLFTPGQDVLMVSDPSYNGITGLALMLGVEVHPIPSGPDGLDPERLSDEVAALRQHGKRPRALYVIPDFDNPLGSRMPLAARARLLALAAELELLLLEDNPYGMYAYDGARLPTLKALDRDGVVIYLGTFSKLLFPSLRLGFLALGQGVRGVPGLSSLASALSRVKSLLSVTTSPLLQAMAGGVLLRHDFSLRALIAPRVAFLAANRDQMLASLVAQLGGQAGPEGAVHWNRPEGGFFLTLELPFAFGEAALERCAARYGVIVCPMAYFSLLPGRERQVRLAFSHASREAIAEGIGRLAAFVRDETRGGAPRGAD